MEAAAAELSARSCGRDWEEVASAIAVSQKSTDVGWAPSAASKFAVLVLTKLPLSARWTQTKRSVGRLRTFVVAAESRSFCAVLLHLPRVSCATVAKQSTLLSASSGYIFRLCNSAFRKATPARLSAPARASPFACTGETKVASSATGKPRSKKS